MDVIRHAPTFRCHDCVHNTLCSNVSTCSSLRDSNQRAERCSNSPLEAYPVQLRQAMDFEDDVMDEDLPAGMLAHATGSTEQTATADATETAMMPAGMLAHAGKRKQPSMADQIAARAQKKPSKKYSRQCRGCGLWHEPQDMSLAPTLCHKCKNKVDSLQRIAASQNQQAWWSEVRSNDVQLQQVLCEYSKRVVDTKSGGKRVARHVTFTFLEQAVASSSTVKQAYGEFMTKRQYLGWAMSLEGDRMSEALLEKHQSLTCLPPKATHVSSIRDESERQWIEYLTRARDPNIKWPPTDLGGPKNEFRMWIKTKDILMFEEKFSREKKLVAQEAAVKGDKMTEELYGRAQKRLHSGHDSVGGMQLGNSLQDCVIGQTIGFAVGFGVCGVQDMAGAMGSYEAGEFFSGQAANVGDVVGLLPTIVEESEESSVKGKASRADDEESLLAEQDGSKETDSNKKRKFFNYDGAVARALRTFEVGQQKFAEDLQWARDEARAELAVVEKLPKEVLLFGACCVGSLSRWLSNPGPSEKVQNKLANEVRAVQSRLTGVELIVDRKGAELQKWILSFAEQKSSSGSQAGGSCVPFAAPTATYKDLCVLDEAELQQKFREATSNDDLREANKNIAQKRKPHRELQTALSGQVKQLKVTKDSLLAAEKGKGKKGKGKGKGKAGCGVEEPTLPVAVVAVVPGSVLFAVAAEKGRQMPACAVSHDECIVTAAVVEDLNLPCIITMNPVVKEKYEQDSCVECTPSLTL
eukprot:6469872-Amphidinium_carterae.1